MIAVQNAYPQFTGLDGYPLSAGYLYFGAAGQNPETTPITVYWDVAGTQPASQPIRTMNGFPVRSGTPAQIYCSSDYSLTVRDRTTALVYTSPNSANYSLGSAIAAVAANLAAFSASLASNLGATLVGWMDDAVGAVKRTVKDKLGETLSLADFGVKATNTPAINSPLIAKALAWAGTPRLTIIAGKIVLATRAMRIPDIGVDGAIQYDAPQVVPEGVNFYGLGKGVCALQYTGTGVALTMGDTTSEHANIAFRGCTLFSTTANASTVGLQLLNCIRGCRVVDVDIHGFGKNLYPKGEAFGLFMDNLLIHDAIVNNMVWEGSTACCANNSRFDTAGDHNIVIDGQPSALLTPPANYSPVNVVFRNCAIQGAQKSGVYGIDVQSITLDECFMESNNQLGATWGNLYGVQGTGAIKTDFVRVLGGYMTAGSSSGTTHRGIVWNSAHVIDFQGYIKGGNFDRGILTGTDVDRVNAFGYINVGGNEIDAQAATVIRYQDSYGNVQIGQRITPTAFHNVVWPVSNGNTALISNTSTTASSVALALKVSTTGTSGYGQTLTDSTGAMTYRVFSNGNVQNANNSYGAISDPKVKENVTAASPALQELLKLNFVNYNLIADPEKRKQLGLLTSEAKKVFPGLVHSIPDMKEGSDKKGQLVWELTGTSTEWLNYTPIYLKTTMGLCELKRESDDKFVALMKRIDALEGLGSGKENPQGGGGPGAPSKPR